MSVHRCFVALDLPDGIRRVILQVQQELRSRCPALRYTREENLHLTLKFLGEISQQQCEEVKARLDQVQSASFPVQLGEAGCFAPRIAWVALKGAEVLQKQIDGVLDGLHRAETRFMGHVTIARAKGISPQERDTLEAIEVPPHREEVTSFSLQESHLAPAGPRYETLVRYRLDARC